MNYVIDTITITRHFSGAGKIGSKAGRIIREAKEGRHTLFISVVSLFEIMYLAEKNRIKVSLKNTFQLSRKNNVISLLTLIQKLFCRPRLFGFTNYMTALFLGTVKYLGLSILSSDKRFDELKETARIW